MVMIGNADQVLALVRNQLERMAREKRAGGTANPARPSPVRTSTDRRSALPGLADLPSEEFERTLIAALLAREFGEDVAQDPRFQQIARRTSDMLRSDPALREALKDVRQALQHKAGDRGRG